MNASSALTRARLEDAEALSELARKSFEVHVPVINAIPVPMSADYTAQVRENEVWVIRSGERLAASLVLVRQEGHLLIESIAVDPDEQGKGYGRQLLDWACHRARAIGSIEVRLYTNSLMTRNRDWYKRAGFAETLEEQRGDKRIVHMRRWI